MGYRTIGYDPACRRLIEEARMADLPRILEQRGWVIKREGRSYRVKDHGGLIIWPDNGEWRWSWFSRGEYGDAISFFTHPALGGMDFKDAVEMLTGMPWPKRDKAKSESGKKFKPQPESPQSQSQLQEDADKWREKANAFVQWANERLLSATNVRKWLAECRGINMEAARCFQIGYCHKAFYRNRKDWGLPVEKDNNGRIKRLWLPPGLVIPRYNRDKDITGITIRLWKHEEALAYNLPTVPNCEIRYYSVPSPYPREIWTSALISWPDALVKQPLVIVESELDAILIIQEMNHIATAALGSAGRRPTSFDQNSDFWWFFVFSPMVLLVLDNDEAGQASADWWLQRYRHVHWWPVPEGKDPTDFFLAGGNIKAWIAEGIEQAKSRGKCTANG